MANNSNISRWSKIATDPLRNFRFYAEFTTASNGSGAFSGKIQTGSAAGSGGTGTGGSVAAGKSSSWVGGFTYISGLNITTQNIPYREGGYNTTVHQIPGMTTFSPITFQRGTMYGNDQAITWMRGLFAAAAGEGIAIGSGKDFRVNVNIYVNDHPNNGTGSTDSSDNEIPKMGFTVHNAWISQLSYSDLSADSGTLLFESMTLVHEGLSVFFTQGSGNDPYKPVTA